MLMDGLSVAAVVIIVLLLVLAALVCVANRASRRRRRATGGGGATSGSLAGSAGAPAPASALASAPAEPAPRPPDGASVSESPQLREPSALGRALAAHSLEQGRGPSARPHPLDQDRYTGPAPGAVGGREAAEGSRSPRKRSAAPAGRGPGARAKKLPRREWHKYPTWSALIKDESAWDAYLADRAEVLESPSLDWSAVIAQMQPKLRESREYVGLINLDADRKTLRIADFAPSPLSAAESRTETTFAGIPRETVERFAARPALFIFHTHLDHPQCSPLPSSHDLSTAIMHGAATHFAANVIISSYGVIVFGLSWCAYKAINSSDDSWLATLNLTHDVVASHEAIRSWSPFSLAEYLGFYPRHRLFCFTYPSSRMVADRQRTYVYSLESPVDLGLIGDLSRAILSYRRSHRASAPFSLPDSPAARDLVPIPGPPHSVGPGDPARPCRALPPGGAKAVGLPAPVPAPRHRPPPSLVDDGYD